jgi:YVTN family beta-propeller protein
MFRSLRHPHRTAALVAAALGSLAAAPATHPRDPTLYVANQEAATISVIDAATHTLLTTVDLQALGFSAKAKPHDTAVEPDGSFWYVSLIGDGFVVKLDRDNHVVAKAAFATPGMLALDSTSDRLFVSRSMSASNPPSSIGVIDRRTMAIDELDVLIPHPHAIVVAPRGGYVYVGSVGANQLATVDIRTEQVSLSDIPGDTMVQMLVQLAVSPDGRRLVGTTQMTSRLLVFDATTPTKLASITAIAVPPWPWHPQFTPDGREVWFGNQKANAVTVVDATTWKVATIVQGNGLAEPHGIAITPDGKTVYVSNQNLQNEYVPNHPVGPEGLGTVVAIDRQSRKIEGIIETGRYAAGMAIGGTR